MGKGENTRARILDAATHQASVRGLAAVSLNDVADAAGMSKSGVFKHFEAKESLHLALLESMTGKFSEIVWEPAKSLKMGRERLAQVLDGWLRWVNGEQWTGGCPIMAATIELDDQPGPLRDYLHASLARWRNTMIHEFQALRDPPLPEAEAEQAYFEFKGYILSFNEARRLFGDDQARDRAMRAFDALCERVAKATA
ncbi:MAG: TetR/AcrR family transcriptional regulator [Caulobacteraceae bacterium]